MNWFSHLPMIVPVMQRCEHDSGLREEIEVGVFYSPPWAFEGVARRA
jgi:hypothetical protein